MSGLDWLLPGLVIAVLGLQIWQLKKNAGATKQEADAQLQQMLQHLNAQIVAEQERTVRVLGDQIQQQASSGRQEAAAGQTRLQQLLIAQQQQHHLSAKAQLDSFAQQLEMFRQTQTQLSQQLREEQGAALRQLSDSLQQSVLALSEGNASRLQEIRQTLEQKIAQLQTDNTQKLEEMRKTVDEKLHATLEQRLGESFRLVSDRLEKVHQGLGEMQQLATGVGDLKKVLTNVKTRGTWGEVQLEMILEQMLTPAQYAKNVEVRRGSGERVEFAIRLPGRSDDAEAVWLPVDAKFPKEQYERLQEAADRADADAVLTAGRELERAVRSEARTIAEKYIVPPFSTDFAILFLPTEGLYAEVMRRPGLADEIQRVSRVTIAGPSTLSALLNSLQMGFRTLTLEKRSSEVWEVLGAVKTEFTKFGDVLAATRTALEKAARNIDQAEVRTRQMSRKLKQVEALPDEQTQSLLDASTDDVN
ncbi:DNA recombination protein RmuC [Undibacterium squillarum]|uniref:DNA recombination protein RmuC n=1 Tax=Undibacterium squillarum TaxID=1131567 RepID=UPI0035B348A4